jgi:hypothetical protein
MSNRMLISRIYIMTATEKLWWPMVASFGTWGKENVGKAEEEHGEHKQSWPGKVGGNIA